VSSRKELLILVSPHVGGRKVGNSIAQAFEDLANVSVVEAADEDAAALARAHVIITGLGPVTRENIMAAQNLEVIQCASHGYDYVDLGAARERGVQVANIGSSGAEKQNVAEQTMALMLGLAKQMIPAHNALARGDWALPRLQSSITELSNKTLGIVGLGQIGREVAKRARYPSTEWSCRTRAPAPVEVERELGATYVELDELLATADYVTLHTPLVDATRGLIDARRLALFKPTAFLINTARGAIVDQQALTHALNTGVLAGAGIDVFDPEPPAADFPLLRAANVLLSPHVAGVTRETLVRIAQAAAANVSGYLSGRSLVDVLKARP
jgi:phosphoglycerate dehydrogenase-like enzyme